MAKQIPARVFDEAQQAGLLLCLSCACEKAKADGSNLEKIHVSHRSCQKCSDNSSYVWKPVKTNNPPTWCNCCRIFVNRRPDGSCNLCGGKEVGTHKEARLNKPNPSDGPTGYGMTPREKLLLSHCHLSSILATVLARLDIEHAERATPTDPRPVFMLAAEREDIRRALAAAETVRKEST